jgi:NTP pyrophosphatase (non-canonical NTP hydrolase)
MESCSQCSNQKDIVNCVSCGKQVCKLHSGHLKHYVSLSGRIGRGCVVCIDDGLARPEYNWTHMHLVVPDAVRRLEHKLYPQIMSDITSLTTLTKEETFAEARVLVSELEDSIQRASVAIAVDLEGAASRIVAQTLEQARETLKELTGEITNAIAHQRIEVKSDAEKIVLEIRSSTSAAIQEASIAINSALQRAVLLLTLGLTGSAGVITLLFRYSL